MRCVRLEAEEGVRGVRFGAVGERVMAEGKSGSGLEPSCMVSEIPSSLAALEGAGFSGRGSEGPRICRTELLGVEGSGGRSSWMLLMDGSVEEARLESVWSTEGLVL